MKETIRMFLLRDLHFMLCSLEVNTLCAKDHGLFYLNYPKINEVRKSDHMAYSTRQNYMHPVLHIISNGSICSNKVRHLSTHTH